MSYRYQYLASYIACSACSWIMSTWFGLLFGGLCFVFVGFNFAVAYLFHSVKWDQTMLFFGYAYKKANLVFVLFLRLIPQIVWICDISHWSYFSVAIYTTFKTRPTDTWIHTAVTLWHQIKINFIMVDVEQRFLVYLYHRVVKLFNTKKCQNLFLWEQY